MKTVAEVYEVILTTARRQAETSAQGKAIRTAASVARNSPVLRTADDLDMLLALVCGNIASIVVLASDMDDLCYKILDFAAQCAAIGSVPNTGDVNATWVATQLRKIVRPA